MWQFYLDLALSVLFRVLKNIITDAELKANMKKALLKLRDAINFAYGEDEDFMTRAFSVYTPQMIEKYSGAAVNEGEAPNPESAAEENPADSYHRPAGGSDAD